MEFRSDEINKIALALSKAQAAIGSAKKDKKGYGYKYAELSSVQDAVREPFLTNELSYTHLLQGDILHCILMHSSGQWLQSDYPIIAQATKNININQARGAAITYGRRYTLAALAGVPQEDDDGVSSAPENVNIEPKPKPKAKDGKAARKKAEEFTYGYRDKIMLVNTIAALATLEKENESSRKRIANTEEYKDLDEILVGFEKLKKEELGIGE